MAIWDGFLSGLRGSAQRESMRIRDRQRRQALQYQRLFNPMAGIGDFQVQPQYRMLGAPGPRQFPAPMLQQASPMVDPRLIPRGDPKFNMVPPTRLIPRGDPKMGYADMGSIGSGLDVPPNAYRPAYMDHPQYTGIQPFGRRNPPRQTRSGQNIYVGAR